MQISDVGGSTFTEAAPFRAHIRRVQRECAAHFTRPVTVTTFLFAAHAGISARGIEHLLHGRSARGPARQIHVELARAVGAIWSEDITDADLEVTRAQPARDLRDQLHAIGWTDAQLRRTASDGVFEARPTDFDLDEGWCSRGTLLRLLATYTRVTSRRICPPMYPAVNMDQLRRCRLSAA